jgi:hypothetical protein
MPLEHFQPVVLGHGCNHQVARRDVELSAGTFVPHSPGELPHQFEVVAKTSGHCALSDQVDRRVWRLALDHGVPSDPARDEGAIPLGVAQFDDLEIEEGRVGSFDDRMGRPQETLLKQRY